MKPAAFDYVAPGGLAEALQILAEAGDDTAVLAGGQSLIPLLNLRLARPSLLCDIGRLSELTGIEVSDDMVRIGALTRARTVERDPAVAQTLPVLSKAIAQVGHPQIRNRTTIGGNIAHGDPASELPAVILALDGCVRLQSLNGARAVQADDFFLERFVTAKRPDELVTGVQFPVHPGMQLAFREVAPRHGDYAIAGACVGIIFGEGAVRDARISLAGVGPRPLRMREAENSLVGRPLTFPQAAKAAGLVRESVSPIQDLNAPGDYRRSVAAVLVRRCLECFITERI